MGQGPIVFQVHPFLPLVASCGESRVIQISSSLVDEEKGPDGTRMEVVSIQGEDMNAPVPTLVVDQIIPPSPTNVTTLKWSPDGGWLAAFQQNSSKVVLWNLSARESKSVDVYDKNLNFLAFSDAPKEEEGVRLAVGTGKGLCLIFDVKTGAKVATMGGGGGKTGKSKMVVGGDWGLAEDGCLGYWTNDGTIVLADRGGRERGTVVPQGSGGGTGGLREISFSPKNNKVFSVTNSKKKSEVTVVQLSEDCKKKVQTELVFKSEWGEVVKTIWMLNGSLLVGFKGGYVVNMDEKNRTERWGGGARA